ncbi:transmembrane emp24 domain-containing protein p24delta3-like [Panicum miliaceum]|uniref:Transmembrane emp24 domain-containing protein p24delta3-like n=1 Tax=Panicum miliaceum TaxID=4540 RepID=A0A3L6TCA3_PANMI|nr:transmembrane emp24 domain-containing protein p24delta3-like [Panicum miliaceum]
MARGGGAWMAAAAVWWMAAGAGAMWLEIAPSGTKCVSEEIRSNVVVIGDYSVLYEHHHAHPTVAVKVTSPFGDIMHKKENVSMDQFAFTTAEAGNYLACFWVDGEDRGLVVKLNLDWKIGIAAKDWDSVAKKEKIEVKEANMRDVSEKTNARVTWLSVLSLSVCVAVSVLQLWHLQEYFRKKKLI